MFRRGQVKRFVLVILAGICIQSRCAAPRPVTRLPERPVPLLTSAGDAIQLLRENYGNMRSLKASGTIITKFPPEHRRKKASFMLALERPDKLRMRTYRPPVPFSIEIISDGQRCWLFVPNDRTAYLSEGCDALYINGSNLAIPSHAIVDAIVIVSDVDALVSAPAHIYRNDEFVVLAFTDKSRVKRELWINPTTGFVERQLIFDIGGEPNLHIKYGEHGDEGNTIVPRIVEITFPREDVSISLRMEELKLNTEIPAEAFEFTPPPETTILQLEKGTRSFSGKIYEERASQPVVP